MVIQSQLTGRILVPSKRSVTVKSHLPALRFSHIGISILATGATAAISTLNRRVRLTRTVIVATDSVAARDQEIVFSLKFPKVTGAKD
jgi:hypothetical protein